MKRSTKIFLGVLSFWPFAYFVLFFFAVFSMIASSGPGNDPPAIFAIIIPFHFLTILSIFGLMVYYIVNVFSNERLPQSKKALWAAVLFLGNMMAIPFYWYFYIWCEPNPSESTARIEPLTDESGNAIIYCASCGMKHPFNTYTCDACGKPLHGPAQPTAASGVGYETVGTVIPYRNTYSLVAYYLAVFSVIPGIGLILGPAALITGVYGIKDVKAHREHKGTLHAWTGIILGALSTLGNIALIAGLYLYFRSV